ncbi:MAG: hypothetical protein FVQ77_08265, partial [Cytophagales bacterium]|nr:hypothetical protein [Cytophagales bacterium]
MLKNKFNIVLLIIFCFPFTGYSQSVSDTVFWTGGWCSLCAGPIGNYQCYACAFGCPVWNSSQRSFSDPVPVGNIVNRVNVTLYYANCGSSNYITLKLNGIVIDTAFAPGACNCGDCYTVTFSKTICDFPNYIYGGTNYIILNSADQFCISMAVITLDYGISLSDSIINVSACNGASDGSADLIVLGGTPPYTYSWSTGDATQDITGISAGTYTVTVTDSNECTADDTVTISELPALPLDIGSDTSICSGDTLTLDAGSGYSSYLWSDSSTSQTITIN